MSKKITALTAGTSGDIDLTSLIAVVIDPSTTAATRKLTLATLLDYIADNSLELTNLPAASALSGTNGLIVNQSDVLKESPLSTVLALDRQVFAASGTWTKPSYGTVALVQVWGPGGPGGSGARRAAGTATGGGGGGAAGAYVERFIPISALSATESVIVGALGTVGAAVTANDTNGNAGVAGTDSAFGTFLVAYAGVAGGGGTNLAAGVAGTNIVSHGPNGGIGGYTAAAAPGGSPNTITRPYVNQAGGGGGGGGINAANVVQAAGNGSADLDDGDIFGSATTGENRSAQGASGKGGAGGAASTGAAATAGYAGGAYGGGGGGGGGSRNGNNSGAGGQGGAGAVIVTVF